MRDWSHFRSYRSFRFTRPLIVGTLASKRSEREGKRGIDVSLCKTMNYRFSGHETFPCRYAWLPKAYRTLRRDKDAFADEERAMVSLGVGKNMVRAIRFWVQATSVAEIAKPSGYAITEFGRALLDGEAGFDPFLEDRRTLWLLHWMLSTHVDEPLFAWDYLLNRWSHPEITRTAALREFAHEAKRLGRKLSLVTLEQHFDTFLHTYIPTRSAKGEIQEDNLDCPLVELEFIQRVGERDDAGKGRREPVLSFRREAKGDITPELFAYCLDDFWRRRRVTEQTLTFRDVSVAHGGPGQIFKLPEWDIRQRLDALENDTRGAFKYEETAALQRVIRKKEVAPQQFLAAIFASEDTHA